MKDTASQANLASEDKNCVPNGDDTVEMKAKDFIRKNFKHLDERKRKSRSQGRMLKVSEEKL